MKALLNIVSRRTTGIAVSLLIIIAIWAFISDAIVSSLAERRIAAAVRVETAYVERSADAVNYNIGRSLSYLEGIPAALADNDAVIAALATFGPRTQPSGVNKELRTRSWLARPDLAAINLHVATVARHLGADVIWIMNAAGDCIACSNHDQPDNLVGINYADRKYFTDSMAGKQGRQYLIGKITNKPGMFFSAPVMHNGAIVGVVGAKINMTQLSHWVASTESFVADENGVIILARDKRLEMRALKDGKIFGMPPEARERLYKRRDFTPLVITPHPTHPKLVTIGDSPVPCVVAQRHRPRSGYTICAFYPMDNIAEIRGDQQRAGILLFVTGLALILSGMSLGAYIWSERRYRNEMERSLAEREVMEQALKESEQFLKLIIDTEPECVKLLGPDGSLQMINRAGLDMIQAESFEMVKERHAYDLVAPDYREKFIRLTEETFEGNPGELVFEIIGLKGRRLWLESHVVPLRNEQGAIISMLGISRNITARKQTEEALADKQQQLEALNNSLEERISHAVAELRLKDRMMIQQSRQAAMGEMINNIAHQWRQPLNSLGLILQGIEIDFDCGGLTEPALKTNVHTCMDIIHFMSHTIDDFRNFFRQDKQLRLFRLKDAVLLALKFIQANLKYQNITVELDIADDMCANGYPNEYAQVVLNILGNAKDALIANGIQAAFIRIEGYSEDGKAVVLVRDNAGGIDADVIDRIFDLYFTTKGEGTGTGIGLYMSKVIIENNMGGRLSARNVNGGAEFRIEIPAE